MNSPMETLERKGLRLPVPPKPLASYVPAVRAGSLLFVSGQLPLQDGQLTAAGPVPSQCPPEKAVGAARQCLLNALAVVGEQAGGDWSRVVRIVRLGVFVQSDAGFSGQPAVANGASDLLVELFGDAGRHARAAVGVNALPLQASVELELVAEMLPERGAVL
jgi:enamine deaminase RidA (YjgF/YER057c/UK114 family)